ncbi:hypothetical protein [Candidatus Albibeggiatoa sp. nov. BB20]|uniref:hypothetical protein n=1 Tax=Candidatus Albibeggiatoa sp. nov. BB20 TaxID=3162723 RepID=UPI003365419B
MQLSIDLPDTPLLLQHQPLYYKQVLLFSLYHLQQISEKEICDMLNLTRREFADLLIKYGFSAISDNDETIAVEYQC